VHAVAGVASFAGCSIDKPGTYTLAATRTGLSSAHSTNFIITVGPAAKLAFTGQPGDSTGGITLASQPQVSVLDAGGNQTSAAVPVALALTNPNDAELTCSDNPLTSSSGAASFAACKVDRAGTYTLTATSGSLTSSTSASFTISVGPAAELSITRQPGDATGGIALATQPQTSVLDAGGNLTTATVPVTLALDNANGAALSCTDNPVTSSAGVASFAGCKVDQAGTYTLTATSGALMSATSASFTISVGPAAKLAFTQQPGPSTGGITLTTQPRVSVQDAGGNPASATVPVTLTLSNANGAVLSCTSNPLTSTSGVASFAGCRVDKLGTYTLTATSGSLTSATSASFSISAGPATQLSFTRQPNDGIVNGVLSSQPQVSLLDAGGNVTAAAAPVTLALNNASGAVLSCASNPLTSTSGVASFAGCRVDKAGAYTLTATSGSLPSATSTSFTITVPQLRLVNCSMLSSVGTCAGNFAFRDNSVLTSQVGLADAAGIAVAAPGAMTITVTCLGTNSECNFWTIASPGTVQIAAGATQSPDTAPGRISITKKSNAEKPVTMRLSAPGAQDFTFVVEKNVSNP
jgi:hypothetical protein